MALIKLLIFIGLKRCQILPIFAYIILIIINLFNLFLTILYNLFFNY